MFLIILYGFSSLVSFLGLYSLILVQLKKKSVWRQYYILLVTTKPEKIQQYTERVTQLKQQYGLSNREEQVLLLILRGQTHKEIALRLFISKRTVDRHAENIYKKCEIKNRMELTYILTK
jgi:DNA-binding NarL/FixJ family response regulator